MAEQYVEQEGKTIEEAVELAMQKLGVSRDQVKITVLSEGTKGLFGLGSKPCKVRVTIKDDNSATPEGILKAILDEIGIDYEIKSSISDGNIHLSVKTPNPGLLIGKRGMTLNSIQYLVNCMANKTSLVKRRIIIDAEQYRERREESLVSLAKRLASKVKATKQEIVVEPMSPQDRRIIHLALQNDDEVVTFSRGEGSMRSVVITTKERASKEANIDDKD
ncbi:TPA: protein jag [Candidatus Poribacteria bacterium]|nr:protein jag [Candidatus Poribacteria bacterium]